MTDGDVPASARQGAAVLPVPKSSAWMTPSDALIGADVRLAAVRRRIYLISVACGLPVIVTVWAVRRLDDPFTAWGNAILAVIVGVLGAALASGRWRVARIERLMVLSLGTFWLVKFAYVLAQGPAQAVWVELEQSSYYSLTLLMAFTYLAFPSRVAVRVSVVVAVVITVVGIVRLAPLVSIGYGQALIGFVRFAVFFGVLNGVLYAMSLLTSMYAGARARADALATLAYRDPLTGLPNRRALYEALQRALDHAERYGRPLSVILFDLDRFKSVNDRFGHEVGDEVLRLVATGIAPHLRSADEFGRWGGEEFVVVAPETDLEEGRHLAERLRESLAALTPVPGAALRVRASFGVTGRGAGEGYDDVLRRADAALYAAKEAGRDRVVVAPAPT